MTKMFHVARVPLIGFVNKKKISFERNLSVPRIKSRTLLMI